MGVGYTGAGTQTGNRARVLVNPGDSASEVYSILESGEGSLLGSCRSRSISFFTNFNDPAIDGINPYPDGTQIDFSGTTLFTYSPIQQDIDVQFEGWLASDGTQIFASIKWVQWAECGASTQRSFQRLDSFVLDAFGSIVSNQSATKGVAPIPVLSNWRRFYMYNKLRADEIDSLDLEHPFPGCQVINGNEPFVNLIGNTLYDFDVSQTVNGQPFQSLIQALNTTISANVLPATMQSDPALCPTTPQTQPSSVKVKAIGSFEELIGAAVF